MNKIEFKYSKNFKMSNPYLDNLSADDNYFYMADLLIKKIYKYNNEMIFNNYEWDLKRKYSEIIYDCKENCFWAIFGHEYIYKLDKNFIEIDFIKLEFNNCFGNILSIKIDYKTNSFYLVFNKAILKIKKSNFQEYKVIHNSKNLFYKNILIFENFYILNYKKNNYSFYDVFNFDNKFEHTFKMPCYSTILSFVYKKKKNENFIYLLVSQNCCKYICIYKVLENDCNEKCNICDINKINNICLLNTLHNCCKKIRECRNDNVNQFLELNKEIICELDKAILKELFSIELEK